MITSTMPQEGTLVGIVRHYFGRPHVAVVRFVNDVPMNTRVHFVGRHTDLTEKIDSMEYDHRSVIVAKSGEEIGVRVATRVHKGDRVYAA